MHRRGKHVVGGLPHVDVVIGVHALAAGLEITSLAFMFVEAPEPVWKTSIGNCPSCSPAAISD
jgi:hypothetical protein